MRAALLLLGLASALASAPRAAAQADALLAELGDPPRLETVRRLVRAAGKDPELAQSFAEGLAARGGHAAAQGLYDLAREQSARVQIAALEGIAEVALRRADGVGSVRTALHASNADVRAAAFCAIARVGDATDLQTLLDALASDDERTRAAADRALSTLTGISFSNACAESWLAWWRESRVLLPRRLSAASFRIDRGGERTDLRDARRSLARLVWFDVASVQERARGWLHSIDARHRAEGYRAAAQCRLGDLADEVRGSARDEVDPNLIFVSLCAAKVLGVEVDGISLPATIPDVLALLDADDEEVASDLAAHADLENLVLERLRLEEERLASISTRASGGAAKAGGASGGGVVWLDLDEKKKRARSAAAAAAAAAPPPAKVWTTATSWSFTWIGFPLVAVAIGLGFVLALRKQGREEAKAEKPVWGDPTPAEVAGDSKGSGAHLEAPLVIELRKIGLHPASLAVAGIRPPAVAAVVHAANRWLAHNFENLRILKSRDLSARTRRDELERLVTCEMAGSGEVAELAEVAARCASIEPELAATEAAFFDAATATLPAEPKEMLNRIRANQAGGVLPAEYLVVPRSAEESARLDEALRAEVEARRRDKDLDPTFLFRLKRARSDLAVWHAHMNRDELLDGVVAAWERAVAAADAQRVVEPAAEMPVESESREESSTPV